MDRIYSSFRMTLLEMTEDRNGQSFACLQVYSLNRTHSYSGKHMYNMCKYRTDEKMPSLTKAIARHHH
jgi:hypothetical protein